jgi:hypothetical protein
MAIPVRNNVQYGGDSINQKYSPLEVNSVALRTGASKEYAKLFEKRISILKGQSLFPSELTFVAENWSAMQTSEAADNTQPPIVVVSNNRADWIKKVLGRVKKNYNDVNDDNAFGNGATPWYSPKRIGNGNIHVYIIVHILEYQHYRDVLKNTGLRVIGWSFKRRKQKSCVGFGASRYAAIEFCKYLFNTPIAKKFKPPIAPDDAGPPIPVEKQMAWLVDDNVAYVSAFPGFKDAVTTMKNEGVWGLGFMGATKNFPDKYFEETLESVGKGEIEDLEKKGLLQQCVLWNIGQLYANNINFSPYFISSNEDTSFSGFLQNHSSGSKVGIFTGATVVKAVPENGGGDPAQGVASYRFRTQTNYFAIEKKCEVEGLDRNQTFGSYVTEKILPNAYPVVRNEHRVLTEAKAVEQIMAKVVDEKPGWIEKLNIFMPNGNKKQNVKRINHL